MSDAAKKDLPPASARSRSARLVAVQVLYEIHHNHEPVNEVLADYLGRGDRMELDGEPMVLPDGILLKKIVTGVAERQADLAGLIEGALAQKSQGGPALATEALLQSIFLCGAYELLAHEDIDAPIIINDYLDVAHGFYDEPQVKLVNWVLDTIKKSTRS